ncbi:aminotransferase class V-fold PLP-dependent enzyme [Nocardia amamiensis]|uniref:aminotransferase class V-fold PLP-dependent enzyme n=1 Tax=Nocardia amamiensis TaxID=404578 RepID=UPI002B4B89D9|nr:aminotransferase class V-fold PLP-dependent enzyme [Nocardia amamiensis]
MELDRAMAQMLAEMTVGAAWQAFESQVSEARDRFAALIGARPDQVAMVPNASVGAYQVASTRNWETRSRIVTTTAEFPSIAHVWLAQRSRGAEVVYAAPTPESYAALIDCTTRLVSVPLIGYQDAARLPVAEVVRTAHAAGAEVLVDAYQAVGVEPVDVGTLDCDFLVAGTSKYLLGLPGLAFLYTRSPERVDHAPRLTGWFGRVDPFAFDPRRLDFPASAARFETGTPAVPACYAANAGLRLIGKLDLATVHDHVRRLTEFAREQLAEQGEQVRAVAPMRRGAHIGLIDPDPSGLGHRLAERDIAVSPRGDVVRLSFHYYSDVDDVAALCAALRDARRTEPRASSHVVPSREAVPCPPLN